MLTAVNSTRGADRRHERRGSPARSLDAPLPFAVMGAAAARTLPQCAVAVRRYRDFDRALLVAIFVTQVFAFVESEFGAVFGLGIDLFLLVGLRSVRARDGAPLPAQPAGAFTEATYPRTSAAGSA